MGKQERNRKVYFDFVGDEKSHTRRERRVGLLLMSLMMSSFGFEFF